MGAIKEKLENMTCEDAISMMAKAIEEEEPNKPATFTELLKSIDELTDEEKQKLKIALLGGESEPTKDEPTKDEPTKDEPTKNEPTGEESEG